MVRVKVCFAWRAKTENYKMDLCAMDLVATFTVPMVVMYPVIRAMRKQRKYCSRISVLTGKPRKQTRTRSLEFNRTARKILRSSEKGKSLLHLPEETRTLRGNIKTHKEGNPVRHITNGTGSAPQRLAKKPAARPDLQQRLPSIKHHRYDGQIAKRRHEVQKARQLRRQVALYERQGHRSCKMNAGRK